MSYRPTYNTEIRETTEIQRHNTIHVQYIDWDYPFLEVLRKNLCGNFSDEDLAKMAEEAKSCLLICEANPGNALIYKHGLWSKVHSVCMASYWPYWEPRPAVLTYSPLGGVEYEDWRSIMGAKIDKQPCDTEATNA